MSELQFDFEIIHKINELKEIKKERRCLQVNYVTFKTDWPVD